MLVKENKSMAQSTKNQSLMAKLENKMNNFDDIVVTTTEMKKRKITNKDMKDYTYLKLPLGHAFFVDKEKTDDKK